MLTLILQSVAGGMYEHDRLALSFVAGAGAHVHATTQGATVVHGMPHGGEACQRVTIHAAAGAFVEHLPDPLILFPSARVKSYLHVVAEPGSTVILGDSFLTHDPEGRARSFGSLFSETSLQRPDGPLLWMDRLAIGGEDVAAAAPGRLEGPLAQGTMWVCSPHVATAVAATLREALEGVPGLYAGASTLPNQAGAWARFLASDAVALTGGFHAAWRALRRSLTGTEPASRRKSAWL
jgi:urease accessory protein